MNEATLLGILLSLAAAGITWIVNRFKIWSVSWANPIKDAGTTFITTALGVGVAFLFNITGITFYPDQSAWLTILSGLGVSWGASFTWELFKNKFKKPTTITPA